MTDDEKNIMRDVYYFLRDHCDPPAPGDEGCLAFWEKAAEDLAAVAAPWKNHPLAAGLLLAVYEYLDRKAVMSAAGSPAAGGG